MEANDAPEKIYIDEFGSELSHDWHIENSYEKDIEYTRTDALMEKTREWIKNNAEKFVVNTPLCDYYDYKRAIQNFENYIKGE